MQIILFASEICVRSLKSIKYNKCDSYKFYVFFDATISGGIKIVMNPFHGILTVLGLLWFYGN